MKKWKLIVLISSLVLVVAVTVTLIIIFNYHKKDSGDYNYPSVIPAISDADETFMTLGSRNISNQEMYNMTITSYGSTSMVDLMDAKLFNLDDISASDVESAIKDLYASSNEIDLDEVNLEDAEQTKTFKDQMALQGAFTDEDIDFMIRLDIARNNYAKEQLLKEIKAFTKTEEQEHFFSENQVNTACSDLENFQTKVKAIILTFRSESEAVKLLKSHGISTSNLSLGWKTVDSVPLTKDQIIEKFIELYNDIHLTELTLDDFPYLSDSDVSNISSVISNTLFNKLVDIEDASDLLKSYTANPNNKSYLNNYYYLVLRIDTSEPLDIDAFFNEIESDTLSEEHKVLFDKLVDNYLTSTYINKKLYELRLSQNPKIYDERLDLAFEAQVTSSLGSGYTLTTEENNKIIITFGDNQITADELFSYMIEHFGAVVSMQFVNFYCLMNETYSTVYNFETKTRLDDFDASYESSITPLKTSLENGELESYGYPATYGFENFLRDYGGLTYPDDAICLGEAYSLALSSYSGSKVYAVSSETDALYEKFNKAYLEHTLDLNDFLEEFNNAGEDVQNSVAYQIMKYFNEFFSVKAINLTYFVDENGDANPEELTKDEREQGELITNAFIYLAKNNPTNIGESLDPVVNLASQILKAIKAGNYAPYNSINLSTVEERLGRLITIYNLSSIDDEVFSSFKRLHLRIVLTSETTYTHENAVEGLKPVMKDLWLKILNKELLLDNGSYAYFERTTVVNPKSTALKAIGITTDTPYYLKNSVEVNNKVSKYIVNEVVNITWYQFYEGEDQVITEMLPPSQRLELLVTYYAISQISSENRTFQQQKLYEDYAPVDFESPYVTNIISAAYGVVIDSERITNTLNTLRIALLNNETVKFANSKYKSQSICIMELLNA